MIGSFLETYRRLLNTTRETTYRYIYSDFSIDNKLTGLIGPRGTGKTTLLLQFIRDKIPDKDSCIYVSLDHIYFAGNLLVDFVRELYEVRGVRIFFFDEVHKYPGWNQELKNLYDSYPEIKLVFSGSSSIDLIRGVYDLSRRGVLYRLEGLSFREYLQFKNIADLDPIGFADLMKNKSEYENEIGKIEKIRGHFKNYLKTGYYPFFLEGEGRYSEKLMRIVEKIIFEDIANFYPLKTENLFSFKRIITYLASIPPGDLNYNSISKHIGLDNKTVGNYINILNETGIVELLRSKQAGSSVLKRKEKIYLNNPDLYHALSTEAGIPVQVGSIREIFFIRMIKNSENPIFYSSLGDFLAGDTYFEIGGRNKDFSQMKNSPGGAFLVKDDITFGGKNEIPLYLFGFLY